MRPRSLGELDHPRDHRTSKYRLPMPKLQHANHASSFRHGQHHVQQITDLLGWPELVDPSYYNDAVDDHSASVAAATRRWSQRFYVDERFWCGGACPVFLLIGGEGPQGPPTPRLLLWHLARKHSALMLAIEHRFYGESRPTDSLTVSSLRLLTSGQALADIVRFIGYVSSVEPGVPDGSSSPPLLLKRGAARGAWVAFGGSYAGALTAWLKLKYPWAVTAAVASSAPVYPLFDFRQYAQVTGSALAYSPIGGSQACLGVLHAGAEELAVAVSGGALALRSRRCPLPAALCPCTSAETRLDTAAYYSSILAQFQSVAQFNQQGRFPDVADVCEVTLSAWKWYGGGGGGPGGGGGGGSSGGGFSFPLAALATVLSLFSRNATSPRCVKASFAADEVAPLLDSSYSARGCDRTCRSDRQWAWQCCNEFGFFQTATGSDPNPFGAWGDVLDIDTAGRQLCLAAFGLKGYSGPAAGPTGLAAIVEYGGRHVLGTNITFSSGSMDPWHALGVVPESDPYFGVGGGGQALGKGVTLIEIDGGSHVRDMYAPHAFERALIPLRPIADSASLRAAHAAIEAQVAQYVSM